MPLLSNQPQTATQGLSTQSCHPSTSCDLTSARSFNDLQVRAANGYQNPVPNQDSSHETGYPSIDLRPQITCKQWHFKWFQRKWQMSNKTLEADWTHWSSLDLCKLLSINMIFPNNKKATITTTKCKRNIYCSNYKSKKQIQKAKNTVVAFAFPCVFAFCICLVCFFICILLLSFCCFKSYVQDS